MKFGFLHFNYASGIAPAELAVALETRGFESLWVPEHTHIPTDRSSPYPAGTDLPDAYRHMMNPFVSLASAASVTERLVLGTGVCLLLQHDLIDLAVQTATLDVLSAGRFKLGAGVGWNAEELANHQRDLPFRMRYSALAERIDALRSLWTNSEGGFTGKWHQVSPSWVYPKPTSGTVPVLCGMAGPVGMRLSARYADEWMPIDAYLVDENGNRDVAGAVGRFHAEVIAAGRDPLAIPATVFVNDPLPSDASIEEYETCGVERVVLIPSPEMVEADETLRGLDALNDLVGRHSA